VCFACIMYYVLPTVWITHKQLRIHCESDVEPRLAQAGVYFDVSMISLSIQSIVINSKYAICRNMCYSCIMYSVLLILWITRKHFRIHCESESRLDQERVYFDVSMIALSIQNLVSNAICRYLFLMHNVFCITRSMDYS